MSRRDDSDDRPQADYRGKDTRAHAVLSQPAASARAFAYPSQRQATEGIGALPARRSAVTGEHILNLHDQLLRRRFLLADIAPRVLLDRTNRHDERVRRLIDSGLANVFALRGQVLVWFRGGSERPTCDLRCRWHGA
jgi:hypothetical protein